MQESELKFKLPKEAIAPEETVYVEFDGSIPNVNMVRDSIVVNYVQNGSLSWVGTKNFPVTIYGGQAVAYDESNPYASVDMADPADKIITSAGLDEIVSMLGVRKFISAFLNTILKWLKNVFAPIASIG